VNKLCQIINENNYKKKIINNIKGIYNLTNYAYQDAEYVGVISIITEKSIIENIICNFKDQTYENKKLFLIVNTDNLPQKINDFLTENINDYYKLFKFESYYSIGHCINQVIKNLDKKYSICAIFNNNCIYEPDYLTEQIKILNNEAPLVAKSNIINFIQSKNFFVKNNYDINEKLYYYGTCVFNINKINLLNINFSETEIEEDNIMYTFISKLKKQIIASSNNNFIGISNDICIDNMINTYQYNYHNSSCSKIINHIFDKIYVINLEHDVLMKNIFINNNFKHNLNITFWKGTYGKFDNECLQILENDKIKMELIRQNKIKSNKRRIFSHGEIGYIASIISILKDAKYHDYKRIIIFDDDALLCNNFCEKYLEVYIKIPYDWNIIRLGSSWYYATMNKSYMNTSKKGYFVTKPTVGSFAICYKNTTFEKLIEECEKYETSYDSGPLNSIGNKDYTLNPNLVIADLYRSTTSGISRNLYKCAKMLSWDLSLFNFVNSLRKISLIIVYNNNQKLIEVIEFILQQTYKNIEIIIVNNASEQYYYNLLYDYLKKKSLKFTNDTENYLYCSIPVSFKNNLFGNTEYFVEVKVQTIQKQYNTFSINTIGKNITSGCHVIYLNWNDLLNCINHNIISPEKYLEQEINKYIKQ
jgi:hypothetical protein